MAYLLQSKRARLYLHTPTIPIAKLEGKKINLTHAQFGYREKSSRWPSNRQRLLVRPENIVKIVYLMVVHAEVLGSRRHVGACGCSSARPSDDSPCPRLRNIL